MVKWCDFWPIFNSIKVRITPMVISKYNKRTQNQRKKHKIEKKIFKKKEMK